MKKLKQIVTQIKSLPDQTSDALDDLLWQYICYAPKMPLRLQQEQLLAKAQKLSLRVKDEFFSQQNLNFNTFSWGSGKHTIILTHGWGSKAMDFSDLISALLTIDEVKIIAFDAPGNGSSEGELSNLLLFVEALKAVTLHYGQPDVLIGHSLGAMANVFALQSGTFSSPLLISLAPLIRLKENFEKSLDTVGISPSKQADFFNAFEKKFKSSISNFNLKLGYNFNEKTDHWLAYDQHDQISPYPYLKDFLDTYPLVKSQPYPDAGHDKILKSTAVIHDLVEVISASLKSVSASNQYHS